MMAAYGLMKKGLSVCIVEKSKELGGFMSPMVWLGVEVGKGTQYLDDLLAAKKTGIDHRTHNLYPLNIYRRQI